MGRGSHLATAGLAGPLGGILNQVTVGYSALSATILREWSCWPTPPVGITVTPSALEWNYCMVLLLEADCGIFLVDHFESWEKQYISEKWLSNVRLPSFDFARRIRVNNNQQSLLRAPNICAIRSIMDKCYGVISVLLSHIYNAPPASPTGLI